MTRIFGKFVDGILNATVKGVVSELGNAFDGAAASPAADPQTGRIWGVKLIEVGKIPPKEREALATIMIDLAQIVIRESSCQGMEMIDKVVSRENRA